MCGGSEPARSGAVGTHALENSLQLFRSYRDKNGGMFDPASRVCHGLILIWRLAAQLSAQRYVSVAAKPNAVRFACSRPQRSINRLDSVLACSIAMASSLWLVGMMLKIV